MEILKEFVVSLVTTLIFMTAIELIGPDNNMKKYLKFVLGLILVAVILNPIVDFLTKGEGYLTKTVDTYAEEITGIKESTKGGNEEKNKIKEENFKDNFNKNCESTLNKEFKDFTFESYVDCEVNFTDMSMEIKSLKIYAKAKGVRKIEKINIGESRDGEEDDTKIKIKDFLSNELKIYRDKIQVNYK